MPIIVSSDVTCSVAIMSFNSISRLGSPVSRGKAPPSRLRMANATFLESASLSHENRLFNKQNRPTVCATRAIERDW